MDIYSRGFRFTPTPQEAVAYYLPRLIADDPLHVAVRDVIHRADLYACDPGALARQFRPMPRTGDRFFFTWCKKRERGAGAGSWVSQSTEPVKDGGGATVGFLKKLRYKKEDGVYSDWLMDEYSCTLPKATVGDKQFVFCKVYVSPRAAPGSAARRESAAFFAAPVAPAPAAIMQAAAPKSFAAAPAVIAQIAAPKRPPPQVEAAIQPCSKRVRVALPATFPAQMEPAASFSTPLPCATNCGATPSSTTWTPSSAAPAHRTAVVPAPAIFRKAAAPQVAMPPLSSGHALPPTGPPVLVQRPRPAGCTTTSFSVPPPCATKGGVPPSSTPSVTQPPPSAASAHPPAAPVPARPAVLARPRPKEKDMPSWLLAPTRPAASALHPGRGSQAPMPPPRPRAPTTGSTTASFPAPRPCAPKQQMPAPPLPPLPQPKQQVTSRPTPPMAGAGHMPTTPAKEFPATLEDKDDDGFAKSLEDALEAEAEDDEDFAKSLEAALEAEAEDDEDFAKSLEAALEAEAEDDDDFAKSLEDALEAEAEDVEAAMELEKGQCLI